MDFRKKLTRIVAILGRSRHSQLSRKSPFFPCTTFQNRNQQNVTNGERINFHSNNIYPTSTGGKHPHKQCNASNRERALQTQTNKHPWHVNSFKNGTASAYLSTHSWLFFRHPEPKGTNHFFLWLVPSRYSRRRCAITIVHIVFITFSKENACLFPRASVIQYSWMIMLSARRWVPWQTAKDERKMKSLGSRGFRGQETTLSSTCFFDCLGLGVPNMDSPPEPAHVHNRRWPFRSLPVRLKASRSQCFNIDWQSNQRREETLRYGAFGIKTLWFFRAQGIKQVPTPRQTAMAMHT